MRAIVLTIMACLLASCVSATREREAHCLAVMMMDAWQAGNDVTSAEDTWRAAQQARFERSPAHRDSSLLSDRTANGYVFFGIITPVSVHTDSAGNQPSEVDEERTLYQRVVAAHARYGEASKWYSRVAQRVQTRYEEDDMLYPVLGMLATSPGIVFYPFVRWNVRSALWDGVDPDADDDPVQAFCAGRLGRDAPGPYP
jgi:hypothetical protein